MLNYDDIINMPHHVSKKRKPMSIKQRSAQFAPFSALKGYQEKINEINKLNDENINKNLRRLMQKQETMLIIS